MHELDLQPSDEQLAAEAAREGSDGLAFRELVRRFEQPVWRICFRLLNNESDAQDAAQEVFVRLFTCRAQFEHRSKYSTWVHGIAVRTSLGFRRSLRRRISHQTAAAEANRYQQQQALTKPDAAERSYDLSQMLETLSEEDRAMLILKYAEDYTYEELAEIFQLSVSACKMRVSRAREKLNQQFGDSEAASNPQKY